MNQMTPIATCTRVLGVSTPTLRATSQLVSSTSISRRSWTTMVTLKKRLIIYIRMPSTSHKTKTLGNRNKGIALQLESSMNFTSSIQKNKKETLLERVQVVRKITTTQPRLLSGSSMKKCIPKELLVE